MAYLSVPKISRHLTFLHLSSPLIVDNCSHIANLSFAITYKFFNSFTAVGSLGWYPKKGQVVLASLTAILFAMYPNTLFPFVEVLLSIGLHLPLK